MKKLLSSFINYNHNLDTITLNEKTELMSELSKENVDVIKYYKENKETFEILHNNYVRQSMLEQTRKLKSIKGILTIFLVLTILSICIFIISSLGTI